MKYAIMILLISVLTVSCKKDKQKENTDNDIIEVTVIANRSSDSTSVASSETIHLRLK